MLERWGNMLNERQKDILKEIVENYIKTVRPIGSKTLCNKFKLSSATIRNEMVALETLGLLEKNHISSGRIPSEKGYKYYATNLMKPKELNGEEMLKIQTIFANQELEISDAITRCMEIISEITNYTSVVLGQKSAENSLQQVSIIPLSNKKIVALVCTDKGIVENKQFVLPEDTFVEEVVKTCEMINKMLVGTPIDSVAKRLEYEVKPVLPKMINQYEQVYNIFYDAFNDFRSNSSNVFFSGKTKMLELPEYDDIGEVKRLLSKFDDDSLVRKIEEDKSGINIYVGEDNEFDSNVTVIKTKYKLNGSEGTLAIVGPKRMEYDRVVGLLEYIQNTLGNEEEK